MTDEESAKSEVVVERVKGGDDLGDDGALWERLSEDEELLGLRGLSRHLSLEQIIQTLELSSASPAAFASARTISSSDEICSPSRARVGAAASSSNTSSAFWVNAAMATAANGNGEAFADKVSTPDMVVVERKDQK
jgi:hypothetical protein